MTGHRASVTGNHMKRRRAMAVVIGVSVALGIVSPSVAIESQPNRERIRMAMERGTDAAAAHRSPDTFYVRFGSTDDLHASGYLVTKLGGVSVMAAHMASRGLQPSETDIAHVLDASTMLISAIIVGDHPSFAEHSYMVLEQGDKIIKPITVRADGQADRSAAWPESPRFKARVVALFNYADFDPKAKTTITVFPASGGELRFSVDFAQID